MNEIDSASSVGILFHEIDSIGIISMVLGNLLATIKKRVEGSTHHTQPTLLMIPWYCVTCYVHICV